MPTFEYRCTKCNHEFEEFSATHTKRRRSRCPECKGKLEQLIGAPLVRVHGDEPKTVGQLAEINSKKLGKEQIDLMEKRDRIQRLTRGRKAKLPEGATLRDIADIPEEKPEPPIWRNGKNGTERMEGPLKMDLSNSEKVEKYIKTGKKT